MSALKIANLRDALTFPSFRECPSENDVFGNPDYYVVTGSEVTPRRHWCLLAEITNVGGLVRLSFSLKDAQDDEFVMYFHTPGRGDEFADLAMEGNTVAILYANKHFFMDGDVGIRQEEVETLKILPFNLNDLLQLSDRIQDTIKNGKNTCHTCGETPEGLSKCGRCGVFYYCNRECQIKGWNDKGHKRDCKVLKNADVGRIFLEDWENFSWSSRLSAIA